jgi:hypothetical protein
MVKSGFFIRETFSFVRALFVAKKKPAKRRRAGQEHVGPNTPG